LKKIKVTKQVRKKVPWYEKPTHLFLAIIGLLVVAGVLMARCSGEARKRALEAQVVAADTTAAQRDSLEEVMAFEHLLRPGDPLPAAQPGTLLPPIRVETRPEAEAARAALRRARGLRGPAEAGEAAQTAPGAERAGRYGFVDEALILERSDGERFPGDRATPLPLSDEQRPWGDFELHVTTAGERYLIAFVAPRVAEALASYGPRLELPAREEAAEPPWWQFWKSRDTEGALALYPGARIELYPSVAAGADCIVALPVARIVPLERREVRAGLAAPLEVMVVELR